MNLDERTPEERDRIEQQMPGRQTETLLAAHHGQEVGDGEVLGRICDLMIERTPQAGSLLDVKQRNESLEFAEADKRLAEADFSEQQQAVSARPEEYTELILNINIMNSSRDQETLLNAIKNLAQLACPSRAISRAIIEMKALPNLVTIFGHGQALLREKTLILLYYLAYYHAENFCDKFLASGLMSPLVNILGEFNSRENLLLFKLVSHTLASLCRGSRVVRDLLQLDELLEVLKKMIEHNRNSIILEQVCLSVAYLAKGSPERLSSIVKRELVPPLVELMSFRCDEVAWAASLAVRNILLNYHNTEHQDSLPKEALLFQCKQVLKDKSEWLHRNPLEIIEKIADTIEGQRAIVEAEIVSEMVRKLNKVALVWRMNKHTLESFKLNLRLCEVLSRTAVEDETEPIWALLDEGLLIQLRKFFIYAIPPFEDMVEIACSIIANISAGDKDLIRALIDGNVFPDLFNVFHKLTNVKAMKYIVTALELTVNLDFIEHIDYLVKEEALQFLCSLLTDLRFQLQALKSLDDILRCGHTAFAKGPLDAKSALKSESLGYAEIIAESGGVFKIERLLNHDNQEISEIARYIYEENFIRTPLRVDH